MRAMYQESVEPKGSVHCLLCPKGCIIPTGGTGACRVRKNVDGELQSISWGCVSSLALDPVEKKPLARFHSGEKVLSVGNFGCNLACRFCQNHRISQTGPSGSLTMKPEELVVAALDAIPLGNIGLAFTYNEPVVGFEFVLETARLVKKEGMETVLVTNGYINPEPLEELLPSIDAMNIDLKAFSDSFYRFLCAGSLEPVKHTIARVAASRCHLEVTTLIIPGHNSSRSEIESLSAWLASISPDIVLHVNRHHPDYLMSVPGPIEISELSMLADNARKHLRYVQCGNV